MFAENPLREIKGYLLDGRYNLLFGKNGQSILVTRSGDLIDNSYLNQSLPCSV